MIYIWGSRSRHKNELLQCFSSRCINLRSRIWKLITAHLWCDGYSTNISACKVWGTRGEVQVSRREFYTHIHLYQVRVEFISCIKKKKIWKLRKGSCQRVIYFILNVGLSIRCKVELYSSYPNSVMLSCY